VELNADEATRLAEVLAGAVALVKK
jgi:hypothetical protein